MTTQPRSAAQLRVVHVLGPLRHSGAEMMLLNTEDIRARHGVASAVISLATSESSTIAHRFEEAGIEVLHVGGGGRPAEIRRYWSALRRFEPDCVHVHAEHLSLLTSMAARLRGARVVRSVHNSFGFDTLLRRRKRLERLIARAVGVRFVAVSSSVAQNEATQFANPTLVVTNWFDERQFVPPSDETRRLARAAFGLDDARPVVALVGNCSAVKNHALLFRAIAECPERRRPVVLHAGEGPDTREERDLAVELGVDDSIHFLGRSDHVVGVLHAADVFAMPSLYEGLGIAAVEGAATGLRLLLADAPGLRDLQVLGSGVTYHGSDADELADALLSLADAPWSADDRAALASRTRAVFDRNRGAAAYIELYHGREPAAEVVGDGSFEISGGN